MNRTTVNQSDWTDAQIHAPKESWNDYKSRHDVSDRTGQVARIDSATSEVRLGADLVEIGKERREHGLESPLFLCGSVNPLLPQRRLSVDTSTAVARNLMNENSAMSTDNQTEYTPADWTEDDTRMAKDIWRKYQAEHDLSDRKGQAAGIDPKTGDVWFGKDIVDIVSEREKHGLHSPLFFVRVGYSTYYRKGSRR